MAPFLGSVHPNACHDGLPQDGIRSEVSASETFDKKLNACDDSLKTCQQEMISIEGLSITSNQSEVDIGDLPYDFLPKSACVAHLKLLHSLVILKDNVQEWGRLQSIDTEQLWRAYLNLAVVRFIQWFLSTNSSDFKMTIPPLDILMVWHAFMLNPVMYSRFCKRTREDQAGSYGIPWVSLQTAIDSSSGHFTLRMSDIKRIDALHLHTDLLEFLKSNQFTANDLIDLLSGSISIEAPSGKDQFLVQEIQKLAPINFTFTPYGIDFDPVAAVIRQASFALKMYQFNWLHCPVLSSILDRATSRYRDFFTLLAQKNGPIVPDLDIDLIWHTHQLSPAKYESFSRAIVGRFVNHNDMIEKPILQIQAQASNDLYGDRFGKDYFVCHSWFCEAARLKSNNQLSNDEVIRIKKLIKLEQKRRQNVRVSVSMERAFCHCYRAGHDSNISMAVRDCCGDCESDLGCSVGDCSGDCSADRDADCGGGECSGDGCNGDG